MEIKTDDESNGLAGSRSRLDHLDHQSIRQIIQIQIQIYVTKIHAFCEIQR